MKRRFYIAMSLFGLLALAAGLTLDGKFRIVVWLALGYFAVRTYIAYRAGWTE